MCDYYYAVAQRWVDDSDASVDVQKLGRIGRYLPSENLADVATPEQKEALSVVLADGTFRGLGPGMRWRPERTGEQIFTAFWTAMREFVHASLGNALERAQLAKRITCPVVHFRCSDVPFSRHPGYHLPKKSFYEWCLRDLGDVTEVIILADHTHNVRNPEPVASASTQYANFIKDVFAARGVRARIASESAEQDFATLFYAPAVIGTGSSFSFMAGYTSGRYYSSQCVESEGEVRHAALPWIYDKLPLLHMEVKDYFDPATVIGQLTDN